MSTIETPTNSSPLDLEAEADGESETGSSINVATISPEPISEPEEREQSTLPLHTALEKLYTDIDVAQEALKAFLGAHFEEAKKLIEPLAATKTSLYGSLGFGMLLVMRSLLTFDSEDVQGAKEHLQEAINVAGRIKRGMSVSTIYTRLSRIFRRKESGKQKAKVEEREEATSNGRSQVSVPLDTPKSSNRTCTVLEVGVDQKREKGHGERAGGDKEKLSEDEITQILRHVDLVTAEAYLLRAILLVATDATGGWVLLMRESLNIRSSYIIYQKAFNRVATADAAEVIDAHYESGILLGNGILNILFALLPPRVFQVFSFLGYTGSISIGLSQLQAGAACQTGLRAPLADLALLMYHTVVSGALAVRRGPSENDASWITVVESVLEKCLATFPESPIYLYYQARSLLLRNEVSAAAEVLESTLAIKDKSGLPQLRHACAWELLTTSMYQLHWHRCYELAALLTRESRWSICFSLFLEATFLAASEYATDPRPETREKIVLLLSQVPGHMQKLAGQRLPIEKYAVQRAQEAIASGEMPFHPEYELLLVWDGFVRMGLSELEKVSANLDMAEQEGLRPEQEAMIHLIRAALFRVRGQPTEAIKAVEKVLGTLHPQDSYIVPAAHAEWAQAALSMKDLKVATAQYELSAGYSHRYILQRSLQLRHTKIKSELARLAGGH